MIQGSQEQSLHFQGIIGEVVKLAEVSEGLQVELEVGGACDKRGQGPKDPLPLWSRKNGRTEEPVLRPATPLFVTSASSSALV